MQNLAQLFSVEEQLGIAQALSQGVRYLPRH